MEQGVGFALQPHFDVCKVEPAFFEGYGRGMRCIEGVHAGEELLRISLAKCWTSEAAKECAELTALGEEVLEAVSDASLIALHILVVRAQGASTPDPCRKEHVIALEASEFETLMDWGEEDLKMLAGSKWAFVAPACRSDIEEEFGELQEILGEFFSQFSISVADFLWAHKLLISRSMQFFMEDGSLLYLLGPGQDMFNHSIEAPVGDSDVNLVSCAETGHRFLVIRAFRDFKAGEQAFYSYSGASNGRLLMMAGFVIPDNPYNSVELTFTFEVNDSSRPMYNALAKGLQEGICTPGAVAVEETRDEFLEELLESNQVVLHMRLAVNGLKAQLERTLAFFRLAQLCSGGRLPSQERLDTCHHPNDECRVKAEETLRRALTQMLARYATSLEEDEAALPQAEEAAAAGASGPSGLQLRRRASSLRVLIGEKQIYKLALEHLRKPE